MRINGINNINNNQQSFGSLGSDISGLKPFEINGLNRAWEHLRQIAQEAESSMRLDKPSLRNPLKGDLFVTGFKTKDGKGRGFIAKVFRQPNPDQSSLENVLTLCEEPLASHLVQLPVDSDEVAAGKAAIEAAENAVKTFHKDPELVALRDTLHEIKARKVAEEQLMQRVSKED